MNEKEAKFFMDVVRGKKITFCDNEGETTDEFILVGRFFNKAASDWWFKDKNGWSCPPFGGLSKKLKPWHYQLINEEDYPKYWDIFWE